MPSGYQIYPLGDSAITLSFGNEILPEINQKVIWISQIIRQQNISGILDIIPAYCTLTIVYDHDVLYHHNGAQQPYEYLQTLLTTALTTTIVLHSQENRQISIPVCYHLSFAPDLEYIAQLHGLTVQNVIEAHTAITYQVYMIGFLPGFPYLGTVDPAIATPRKATPRTNVPAGSIGIAGQQTGIYPFDSPGGWQLIGRTPVPMFIPDQAVPVLLQPGDKVRFYPISLEAYQQYQHT